MRIRSSFTQSILLFFSLLIASQIYSYYAVFNYALLPSLQQFNKILAHEISLMLDDTSNPNVSSEMDALLKRRVLEQLGVTIHSNDSPEAVEYQHVRPNQHQKNSKAKSSNLNAKIGFFRTIELGF